MRFVLDQNTIRGCLAHHLEHECNNDTCVSCRSDKCNSQIFPENRLSCLHCGGSSCVNQTNTIKVRYFCANYDALDECYSVFSHGNLCRLMHSLKNTVKIFVLDGSFAYRGCLSDGESFGREFCMSNSAQCERCSKRACNANPLKFEKPLSCVKCDSNEPDSNCLEIDESIDAIECKNTTVGYKNKCYIYQKSNHTIRGCLYEAFGGENVDIFKECSNSAISDYCYTCNESDCNRNPIVSEEHEINPLRLDPDEEETPASSCYECNSKDNADCASILQPSMIINCPFSSEDEFGCYHKINGKNRLIINRFIRKLQLLTDLF